MPDGSRGTKTKVAALVGPTAAGKTAIALALAPRVAAEIVSVDSMQIYRGMDIGTATPPPAELEAVPHHLVNLRDPSHELTVAEYQTLGRAAIADIAGRGRLPLLVGGSGLYFRAIVDDLTFPPRDPEVRAALERDAEEEGAEALHDRLRALDPRAAERIEPRNARRTVRALEVIAITGQPFSAADAWDHYASIYELSVAGLTLDRASLGRAIGGRVEMMLARGLVEEARAVERQGMSTTARQALGYRQVLDAPHATLEELAGAIASATRRFARRQESWFRADPRITWFDASDASLVERLEGHFRASLALACQP